LEERELLIGQFDEAVEAERAARQQGSSFLRENSSNGGKAIRTFWLAY
jgi:tRNA 2-selenouridine synthase SelU